MKRRSLRLRLVLGCLALVLGLLVTVPVLLWLGVLPTNRAPSLAPPLELGAAVAAYEKLGATYGSMGEGAAGDSQSSFRAGAESVRDGRLPAFRFQGASPGACPDVAVPFGLDLSGAPVTDADLKALGGLKNLRCLHLDSKQVTDGALRSLREAGLLHMLPQAQGKGSRRPSGPDDVTTLNLSGTRVTDKGLKELAGLKNLTTLDLSPTQVTDDALRTLREAGLLHALTLAQGKDGKRPAGPDDVTTLDLSGGKVTDAGLKEIAGLKNLTTLSVPGTQVTDGALRTLREAGLLHALSQAKGKGGQRPAGPDDVTTLDLNGTGVTDAGLKEIVGLKNLTLLDLHYTRVTDGALRTLREAGLLHTLSLAGGKDGQRPTGPDDVTSLNLRLTPVTDAGLKELAGLKNLTYLYLGETPVTDDTLRVLQEAGLLHALPQARGNGEQRPAGPDDVTNLDLRSTHVTDAGLKDIAGLKNLIWLDLRRTGVTDAGLKEIAGLKNLKVLYLDGSQVTDVGLKEITGLKNLTDLGLSKAQVTDGALRTLREAGLLHALSMAKGQDGKRPTGPDDVTGLSLQDTGVTDEGLKEIAGLKNLIWLELSGTQVTDVGLKEIAGLRNLTALDLNSTQVTDAGLKEIRKALPKCRVSK